MREGATASIFVEDQIQQSLWCSYFKAARVPRMQRQRCCILCFVLFSKGPKQRRFLPWLPVYSMAAHLRRDLDWEVQSFVLYNVGFCGTVALEAEIFCLVGRRDKTKFDLAPLVLSCSCQTCLPSVNLQSLHSLFCGLSRERKWLYVAVPRVPRLTPFQLFLFPDSLTLFYPHIFKPSRLGSGWKVRKVIVKPRKQPGPPFLNFTFGLCGLVLCQLDKLKSFGKRDPHLKKMPHQTGLWANLRSIFLN